MVLKETTTQTELMDLYSTSLTKRHLSKKQLVSSPLVPSFLWPTCLCMCLYFSTEGVYIFLRKAFTFFYGRRLYFSTEGVDIFLRKVQDFYGKVRFIKNEAPFPKKRLDYLHRISIFFYGRCEPPGPPYEWHDL